MITAQRFLVRESRQRFDATTGLANGEVALSKAPKMLKRIVLVSIDDPSPFLGASVLAFIVGDNRRIYATPNR